MTVASILIGVAILAVVGGGAFVALFVLGASGLRDSSAARQAVAEGASASDAMLILKWEKLHKKFGNQVLDDRSRKQMWRKHRRNFGGELRDWSEMLVSTPTQDDVDALAAAVAELAGER